MNESDDSFNELFPGDKLSIRLIRSFYRFISIDAKSLHTKGHLKSSSVIKSETLRHLLFHRNVIHCFSRFRYYWEILLMICFILSYLLVPFDSAFSYGHRRLTSPISLSYAISFLDIISLIDIAINFCSSYQDPQTKEVVLEGRKIASYYLRGHFWLDLFSSFPDRIAAALMSEDKRELIKYDLYHCVNDGRWSSFPCYWDALVILSLLKFLQMPLFFKYLTKFLQHHSRSSYFIKFVRDTLAVVFWYHFVVCLSFLIIRVFVASSNDDVVNLQNSLTDEKFWNASNFEKYVVSFFYTTYTISLFASAIEEKNQMDMMVGIIYTLFGFVLHIWLVSEAYMFLRTSYGPSIRFQEIRYQMKKFMSFKRISASIQRRVLKFYDFSFNGKFFRKRDINELLGNELRYLVTKETCEELLKVNHLFKSLPDELLLSVANCMTENVFLVNDVICQVDSLRAQKLYLIVSGTVAVYDEKDNELSHLYDGSMFGEAAFLLFDENFPSFKYVAVEETILFVLNRTDFMKAFAENPDILSEMRDNLKKKFEIHEKSFEEVNETRTSEN